MSTQPSTTHASLVSNPTHNASDASARTITVIVVDAKLPPSTAKSTNQITYIVSYQFYDTIDVEETPAFENSRDVPISFARTFELKQSEEFCEALVRRPLRFTLYEVIPSGRSILGVAEVPMDVFVSSAQTELADWFPVKLEDGVTLIDIPSIQISIKLSEPLLTDEQRAEINILSIHLDAMYSLPSRWAVKDGQDLSTHPFLYAARISVPQTEETDTQFYFSRGTLMKSPTDPSGSASEQDMLLSEQEQFWQKAEKHGDRIHWNITHKIFISSTTSKSFMQLIETKPLLLELRRLLVDTSEPDPNAKKYQASSQFVVSRLLSPGISSVVVRSPVVSYVGNEPADSPFDNRIHSPKSQEKGAKPVMAVPDKSKVVKKPVKKKRPELEPEEEEPVNPYEAAGSYLLFTINMMRPFVQQTKKKRNLLKPTDLIPPRNAYGPAEPSTSATDEFGKTLQIVSQQLAMDFQELYLSNLNTVIKKPESKEQFIYELNASGKFVSFKQKIQKAVAAVVKERFSKKQQTSKKDFDQFYNKLYVYLIGQMHATINKLMDQHGSEGDTDRSAENLAPILTQKQLLRLAEEAECDGNYKLADEYIQKLLELTKENPSAWFEYAQFLLRTNDKTKAEEILRETISRDSRYVLALVAYGASLLNRSNFEHAEVYLRGAADADPKDPCIWLLLTILYERMDNEEELKNAQQKLRQVLNDESGLEQKKSSVFLRTARMLLSFSNTTLLEPILAHETAASGRSVETCIISGKMYALREDFGKAEELFQEAVSLSPKSIDARIEMGHMQFKQQKFAEALSTYESVLNLDPKCPNLDLLTRLAKVYSLQGQHEDAKELYLACCQISPTSLSWLGAGHALYRMGLYEDAEVALSEANIHDNSNPDTWCILALLCLSCDYESEADRCTRQALRFNPSNASLLRELGVAYSVRGKGEFAESCLRLSLEIDENDDARLALANILVSKNDRILMEEAAMHYSWVRR
eukprot:TRINITY_DN3633_c0_g1_i7.p1 TRINITY_DN3633_c0_g1~~TRINITY_DN3633_c0_g1_i7.p1  ORF type:complete len:983 (+),score=206.11 TRINITY_DN3633_c0_g1_i7:67-3015(+)